MNVKMLTKENRKALPKLYSQENAGDEAVAHVKFFSPYNNLTWYAFEFDGEDIFFGWVIGFEKELGYFSLSEMESAKVFGSVPAVERDRHFSPTTFGELKAHYAKHGYAK